MNKTNKNVARHMLTEIGQLKHALNILTTAANWIDDIFITWDNQIDVTWWDDDLQETAILAIFKRGGDTDKKATRKLFAAFMLEGTEGVLNLLERKNAALRGLVWKELNRDDNDKI